MSVQRLHRIGGFANQCLCCRAVTVCDDGIGQPRFDGLRDRATAAIFHERTHRRNVTHKPGGEGLGVQARTAQG